MPELKRNFLKGKMNKDLDERLVPSGEYRDALNVEIETSEGSNVGALQTLSGNTISSNITLPGSYKSVTVGSFCDSANDRFYNFIHRASDFNNEANAAFGNFPRQTGVRSDVIEEFTPNIKTNGGVSDLVFVDVYDIKAYVSNTLAEAATVITLSNSYAAANYCGFRNFEQPDGSFISPIKVGMKVQAVATNGVNNWSGREVVVRSVAASSNSTTIVISKVEGISNPLDQAAIDSGVVIRFVSDRVLNFYQGKYQEQETNTGFAELTYTPDNSMITSINKIDDFLLFTDGRNEPKKINIPRFKRGTTSSVQIHTKLYSYISQTYIGAIGTEVSTFFPGIANADESHIAVIKRNPDTPIKVKCNVNETDVANLSIPVLAKELLTDDEFAPFALSNNANVKYEIGQVFYIKAVSQLANYEVDDVIRLVGQSSATAVFVRVDAVTIDADNSEYYTVVLQTEDEDYVGTENDEVWVASIAAKENLYKDVFVNFAYRYVYTDGEKSCISPYSKSAFLPGLYSYSSKDGFNLGMENQMSSVDISGFIPFNIPLDVVEVEILFKSSKSENVYSAMSIKRDSDYLFDQPAPNLASRQNGKIRITNELFGSALPISQLNRNFDAVPKKAVAQEIMANRLMYANYHEDYNLKDVQDNSISLNLNLGYENDNYAFYNSFNSTNNFFATGGARAFVNDGSTINRSNGIPIFATTSQLAGAVSTPLPLDIEYDPGNNYSPGAPHTAPQVPTIAGNTSHYTIPFLGSATTVHTFTFEIEVKIEAWSTSPSVSNPQLRLGVFSSNGSTAPQATGSPLALSSVMGGGAATEEAAPGSAATTLVSPYEHFVTPAGITSTVLPMSFSGEFQITSGPQGNQNKICFAIVCVDAATASPSVVKLVEGRVAITQSPDSTNAIQATQGIESVKSDRFYQVGVVYRDKYGRESSVLQDEKFNFSIPKENCDKRNFITSKILSKAPAWAETYKYFIKESTQRYNNLVLEAAFDNNDGEYAWLVFNSVDRNKVQVGDKLISKKKQGLNDAVTAATANWKIIDIEDNGTENASGVGVNVAGIPIDTAIIADASELVGKFFVKVNYDADFISYIGNLSTTIISAEGNNNGAVFETKPEKLVDTDLYYEVGQAYPIKLNTKNLGTYITPGMRVEVDPQSAIPEAALFNANTNLVNPLPQTMVGASCFAEYNNNPSLAEGNFGFAKVVVNQEGGGVTDPFLPTGTILRFLNEDGSYVTARLARDVTGSAFYLEPFTHRYTGGESQSMKVRIPWFNCYAFGNGVESDTIRDDFNEGTIYPYAASGKQSGFKGSIPLDVYKERHRKHEIIFSSIYNDKTNVNRLNEFLLAETIVKSLNPEYGSIQKLFSRNNDLLTICEDKCLKVLSQKDALFNADGNSQLLSSTNVLGQAIPFAGDYGISKNPESFAVDEYRIYFADRSRGAVLRLSGDGLTPISDYGMDDFFNDTLKNCSAIIGGFDSKKDEYNLTMHETTAVGYQKKVHNATFSEGAKGWVSFKSFIPESSLTLNNTYFTFKNGIIYKHHVDTEDSGVQINANRFYGKDYTSSVTSIFNDAPDTIKTFYTVSYEGSQSKIDAFTNVLFNGDTLNDNEYYNSEDVKGWYLETINTDLQEGSINEFIEKEGKWYNYIKGVSTSFTNSFEGSAAGNNLDMAEFSVQGVGQITSVTLESGAVTPAQGISITIEVE